MAWVLGGCHAFLDVWVPGVYRGTTCPACESRGRTRETQSLPALRRTHPGVSRFQLGCPGPSSRLRPGSPALVFAADPPGWGWGWGGSLNPASSMMCVTRLPYSPGQHLLSSPLTPVRKLRTPGVQQLAQAGIATVSTDQGACVLSSYLDSVRYAWRFLREVHLLRLPPPIAPPPHPDFCRERCLWFPSARKSQAGQDAAAPSWPHGLLQVRGRAAPGARRCRSPSTCPRSSQLLLRGKDTGPCRQQR